MSSIYYINHCFSTPFFYVMTMFDNNALHTKKIALYMRILMHYSLTLRQFAQLDSRAKSRAYLNREMYQFPYDGKKERDNSFTSGEATSEGI